MSELLLTENEKRCWNKAYLKHVTPLSEIREGWEKNSHVPETHCYAFQFHYQFNHTRSLVIGKEQSEMPDWSVKLRIQRPLC